MSVKASNRLSMNEKQKLHRNVRKMYLSHPFPQWGHEKRVQRLPAELCRYRFLGFENEMPGSRLLDVGCGTGNRSMLVAKHYGVREFVGLDASTESLSIAQRVADEEAFERFRPVEGNLFEMPFEDNSFDVVVSWGVLHHTASPIDGLKEMVRVCRPGGCIGLFVYNRYADWRHNMQKNKVSRIAGDDFEERFEVAHRLYGTKPIDEMSPEEIAVFYDQFCHPHKSDHTIGEVLSWFKQLNLKYSGSYPPLRFADAIRCVRYRADLLDEYPIQRKGLHKVMGLARKIPFDPKGKSQYRKPGSLHKFLWQSVYAWQGRSGYYSHGVAVGARKPGNAGSASHHVASREEAGDV